jgi:creatinine amidohydrolase
MRICDMSWMQLAERVRSDDRCVLPLGSTEQHAQLSLSVDSILAERLACDAAEPLGVPVFPVVPYGITPYFRAYPGTVSLGIATYLALISDILDGLYESGFRRVLLCNGHGGNSPAASFAVEWMVRRPDCRVRFHSWWLAPRTSAEIRRIDDMATHASWMENFAWTRLSGADAPLVRKPLVDPDRMRLQSPQGVRGMAGDGNLGGAYQRSDADMDAVWSIAVAETRALIEGPWQ